jgi:hypothetical protein
MGLENVLVVQSAKLMLEFNQYKSFGRVVFFHPRTDLAGAHLIKKKFLFLNIAYHSFSF